MIELMLSLTLSAVLFTGVAQVITGMRQTERLETALAEMQAKGRLALHYLTEDIRQAGFPGCSSVPFTEVRDAGFLNAPGAYSPALSLQGWEARSSTTDLVNGMNASVDAVGVADTGSGWISSPGSSSPGLMALPGSDIIRVMGVNALSAPAAAGNEGRILGPVTADPVNYLDITAMELRQNDSLLLSDCSSSDRIVACSVTENTVTGGVRVFLHGAESPCTEAGASSYSIGSAAGGSVFRLSGNTWYIGKRGDDPDSPPALFSLPGSGVTVGNALEMVEGIANLQFLYGENTDNSFDASADDWVSADSVIQWGRVVSVRLNLLVQSREDNLIPRARSYRFAGNTYMPEDRRLRRVFTTTVGLRNRMP